MNIYFKAILPLSLLFVVACESNVNASPQTIKEISIFHKKNIRQSTATKTTENHKMISFAKQYLGTRYVWGGITPKGFDCSGFIQYVYKHFDIYIPRTTASYTQLFDKSIPLKKAKVGDLIIFTGTNLKIRKPGHAGIITEVKPGRLKFIHSSSSKKHFGVTETSYYQSGYPKRFLTVIQMPNPSKRES
ncbi:C40 family peptidase [Photobacterium carnosum]|uniref:C40 family peptidase n=1 Tax=Photobacterium carnosum TaxID=2023717 RepID=UPI001F9E9932|nr:C40 family peptidase [Photobacterium carnosum]MCD9531395.1 NlpC/P60 family protein [Photobacterium carnosum]MCF2155267.1 NlpC/P60 family protein [Photobacterium carnosum]MCF2217069.1 NlpC/P60 family protein [Photobacterium carnosum]